MRKLCSVADEYMNNYFTSFCQLTHLGANNIRATIRERLCKCTIIGGKQLLKKNVATLNRAHQTKKQRNFDSSQSNNRVVYIASISFESNKFVRRLNKVERSIFKNNNQINSTVTTRRWVLLTEWTRSQPGAGLVYEWSMLFFRMCWCCIVLTMMKTMSVVSLSFSKRCYQCSFFEIFKGRQVILEPCRKLKYPIK